MLAMKLEETVNCYESVRCMKHKDQPTLINNYLVKKVNCSDNTSFEELCHSNSIHIANEIWLNFLMLE